MQKRAIETKTKILSAAKEEFSAKGFHGTTVDEIAGRAGVNKQRIYAYFTNKENLFEEILIDCFLGIMAAEKSFLNLLEDDIPHLGEILLRHYFQYHQEHPEFWRLLAWGNLEGDTHLEVLQGIRDQTFQHLRELYQKGQTQRAFIPEVSFETYIFTISAICFFYFSNQRTMSQTLNRNLANQQIREQIIKECLILLESDISDIRG